MSASCFLFRKLLHQEEVLHQFVALFYQKISPHVLFLPLRTCQTVLHRKYTASFSLYPTPNITL